MVDPSVLQMLMVVDIQFRPQASIDSHNYLFTSSLQFAIAVKPSICSVPDRAVPEDPEGVHINAHKGPESSDEILMS